MSINRRSVQDCDEDILKALADVQSELRRSQRRLIQKLGKLVRRQGGATYGSIEAHARVATHLQRTLKMLDAKLILPAKPEQLLNIRHVAPKQSRLGSYQLWRSENAKLVCVASGSAFPTANVVAAFDSPKAKEREDAA